MNTCRLCKKEVTNNGAIKAALPLGAICKSGMDIQTATEQHDITRCALISLTNAHYMHISSFYESTIYSIGNPIAIVTAHSCSIFIDESQRVASLYPFHAAMRSLNTLTICATFCTILYTYIFKKEGILYTFPLGHGCQVWAFILSH
eukprot:655033_1